MIASYTLDPAEEVLVLVALGASYLGALVLACLVHYWRGKARSLQTRLSAMQGEDEPCKPLPAKDVQQQKDSAMHGRAT